MSENRPLEDRTPYTTSKTGVIGFTRTLAVELADHSININAICPGTVEGLRLNAIIEGRRLLRIGLSTGSKRSFGQPRQ